MTAADPLASLKAANKDRSDAWNAEPAADVDEPEEELELMFRVKLPATTVGDRWELARFLEETAERTVPSSRWGGRTADWEMALIGVLTDLAKSAREAQGKAVASAEEAQHVVSVVTISAAVPLNQEARERLFKVLVIAAGRAGGSGWTTSADGIGDVVKRVRDEFETFTYGRGGQPSEDPWLRRKQERRPGMWEPMGGLFRGSKR